jgi:hypothetical protein
MPEKRPVKFWGSTKEAGFAAFSNAIMKSCRPSCRPATFGFQAFPALWPARSVGTISAQHGLEEIKNPKKVAGRQLFGGPRQRPPCRSISSGPAYFRGLLRLCVRPASRPAPRPMLKGTDFPYKDSSPLSDRRNGRELRFSGQGEGACWAFRSISRPARRTPGFRTLRIAELRSL